MRMKFVLLGLSLILMSCASEEKIDIQVQNKSSLVMQEKQVRDEGRIIRLEDKKVDEKTNTDTEGNMETDNTMDINGEPLAASDIEALKKVPFYRNDLEDRYIAYQQNNLQLDAQTAVLHVNVGIDQPFYSNVQIVENTMDRTLLVNKFYGLADNYTPVDLVATPYICDVGSHYACSGSSLQYVRSEVAEPFAKLVEAAKAVNIDIYSISSYRTFAYQNSLYTSNVNASGQAYADLNFARPGQSEHNTGLAIDVSLNQWNFNEIHYAEEYPWLVENMATYGFILRYPADKTHLTGFLYEPWHLRYVGTELAQEIMNNQWCLEEYYARIINE